MEFTFKTGSPVNELLEDLFSSGWAVLVAKQDGGFRAGAFGSAPGCQVEVTGRSLLGVLMALTEKLAGAAA